jgi:uncharacterized protein YodC (DUF2158 family)
MREQFDDSEGRICRTTIVNESRDEEPENVKVQTGDVVFLKSGGPPMTAYWIEDANVHCQWFAGDELRTGIFVMLCLIPKMKFAEVSPP